MTRYIIRRMIQMIPLLIGISILAFLIIRLAPGDPLSVYIDPNKPPPSAADMERLREELGLNDSLPVQYIHWLENALKGDLGFSLSGRRPVLVEIGDRLPNTLLLGVSALILTAVISIPVGIISAMYRYSMLDYVITFLSFIGLSIPGFVIALFLIQIFAVQLRWLPSTGMRNVRESYEGWQAAMDVLSHLILPTIALSLSSIARWARYQRSSLLDVLSQDYIRTAQAKGLRQTGVLVGHALRNALLPMITLAGLSIPLLVSGAFIIEYVFGWPGMGRLAVNAALRRDYPVIMGVTMISAIFIVIGNFMADVAYNWADPRIRYD